MGARHANADSYSGSQSNIASSHIYVHDIRVGHSLPCNTQVVPIDVAQYLGVSYRYTEQNVGL